MSNNKGLKALINDNTDLSRYGNTSRSRYPILQAIVPTNPHPWLGDLRLTAQWMDSWEFELPHGKLQTSTDELGVVFVTDCEPCRQMFKMRFEAFLLKEKALGIIAWQKSMSPQANSDT